MKISLIKVKHKQIYPEGQEIWIAPESALTPSNINSYIDDMIYYYVEDEIFNKGNWKLIAEKHLDEPFEFVEFIELREV